MWYYILRIKHNYAMPIVEEVFGDSIFVMNCCVCLLNCVFFILCVSL